MARSAREGEAAEGRESPGTSETGARWLDQTQSTAWRSFLTLHAHMFSAMNQDLQRSSGLSLADYEVLVHLTDVPGGRRRSFELSRSLDWEKSRLSKQVTRMEKRGLVAREHVAEDRRGAWVVLTEEGRKAIEEAAPAHVELVNRLMFDGLSERQEAALAAILLTVVAHIEGNGGVPEPA